MAVVAGAGDRPVDQRLERHPRRGRALGVEALEEGARPREVRGRAARAPRAPSARSRSPRAAPTWGPCAARARAAATQGDRVEREPGERRAEHRVQRQLVERVGQRREPVAQVAHLLLAPVAATAHHVGGDPALHERALVHGHAGGGAQEHHHVAVVVGPVPGELVDPAWPAAAPRAPATGCTPAIAAPERSLLGRQGVVPAPLVAVHHQQLHGGPVRCRLARAGSLAQRLVVLSPEALEGEGHGVDQLAARAEVHRHARAPGPPPRPPRGARGTPPRRRGGSRRSTGSRRPTRKRLSARDQPEQLALERVHVLELVDHHVLRSAPSSCSRSPSSRRQQVAREQLEVLEVERRALALAPSRSGRP